MFGSVPVGYAIGAWVKADGVNFTVALIAGVTVGLIGYCILWYGLHQFTEKEV
jgi:hypothetical protein